uniref:Adenylyl-sulfate kinase n=1 Tax=Magnetococcus massalia (strain MO-1) TaxID=451514 RepID=A0A1S7LF16_MAGMO|nr:Adenylyl-sulfate kinase [Candidatus Magnetococcus massalia]
MSSNIVWHDALVSRQDREKLHGHRSLLIWFTGLSGAGKSTLMHEVGRQLHDQGRRCYTLDGDNIRHGLCNDLGFSDEDRKENIRRIGEVANLFVDAGTIVLAAFISPFRSDRQRVRNLVEPGDFVEVYCNASLEVCEERDTKGLYKKARAGEIREFTGISSPYEAPNNPELAPDTGSRSVEECATEVIAEINKRLHLDNG